VSPGGKPTRILLGRIADAHGIRGDVLIHAYTASPEAIGAYGALSDKSGARAFEIQQARVTPKGVIARLAGVSDRNAAEALKGTELYVERDRLPPPADGEFYHADLIGLAAFDRDGAPAGEIVAVVNFGAGDLLEVRFPGAGTSEFVPFTEDCVPTVDIAAGRVVIALPSEAGDEPE
jgi:16S rRNA processing protein RimM